MQYIYQHIQSILSAYDGSLPLTHFLKPYFKRHPKLGSRDRRLLAEAAYAWYRFHRGISGASLPFEEQLYTVLLLSDSGLPALRMLWPETWEAQRAAPLEARIAWLQRRGIFFDAGALLPGNITFSAGTSRQEWLAAFLQRPRVFLRVAAGQQQALQLRLQQAGIPATPIGTQGLALAAGSAADKVLEPGSYRIQDASSQQTGQYFLPQNEGSCWDCCSGAGGKSLLFHELYPDIRLTVSDIRASILQNLSVRFRQYGYKVPECLELSAADAAQTKTKLGTRRFDQIICDVPCSGSGTWARTPEQCYFFDPSILQDFAARQLAIAANVSHYLKPGGTLVYITCSVFAAENEAVIAALLEQGLLELKEQQIINGTAIGADSMFVAVLIRKS